MQASSLTGGKRGLFDTPYIYMAESVEFGFGHWTEALDPADSVVSEDGLCYDRIHISHTIAEVKFASLDIGVRTT